MLNRRERLTRGVKKNKKSGRNLVLFIEPAAWILPLCKVYLQLRASDWNEAHPQFYTPNVILLSLTLSLISLHHLTEENKRKKETFLKCLKLPCFLSPMCVWLWVGGCRYVVDVMSHTRSTHTLQIIAWIQSQINVTGHTSQLMHEYNHRSTWLVTHQTKQYKSIWFTARYTHTRLNKCMQLTE